MPSSDQIVTARLILQAQLELRRLGSRKVLTLLERTEPDLTEWLLENSSTIYHQILEAGASPRQARRLHRAVETLVLVSLLALQKAHRALWQEGPGHDLHLRLTPPGPATTPSEPPPP